MKRIVYTVLGMTAIIAVLVVGWVVISPDKGRVSTSLSTGGGLPENLDGFSRAAPGKTLNFPQDYGPHEDYLTEWWYYTGSLQDPDGGRFGYQLTFFRRGLISPAQVIERDSTWAADQIYLAHFALTDIENERFQAFERFSRGSAGLAGAQVEPYRVWLYDWEVLETAPGVYQLYAREDRIILNLVLVDAKGPVLQGEGGYSRKGDDPGNASYYISQTRLETEGSLVLEDREIPLAGLSWMDHEFSTSALTEEQVGWDWFSIQLDNEVELMLFEIRRQDGSIDPFSSGTLIYPDGTTRQLSRDDFEITGTGAWESPHSGAVYPAGWEVAIPEEGIRLLIAPLQADQELNLTYTYWEGAVSVNGTFNEKTLSGSGYVELTGYAASMENEF